MTMAATLLVALPWFGLSVGNTRGNCVEVAFVQPGSPAGSAGLHAGDCLSAIDAEPTRDTEHAAATLKSKTPRSRVRITLATGRAVVVTPTQRTEDLERSYCEYLKSVRTEIEVAIFSDTGPQQPIRMSLPPPVTLGELRKRVNAPKAVRVTAGDKCAKTPTLMTDDPPDTFVIPDGASLIFGYDRVRIFRLPQVQVDSADELRQGADSDGGKTTEPTDGSIERR